MDVSEKIFQKVAQWWQRLRHVQRASAIPGEVELETLRARLQVLAALLSEELPEVRRAGESGGGWSGDTLLLPRRIAIGGDESHNERIYLYRLAYAVESRALGFVLPERELGALERSVLTLLAVSPTQRALATRYEGASRLLRELSPRLLEAYPAPERVGSAEDVLQLLVRRLLGVRDEVAPEVGGWLERAAELEAGCAEALWEQAEPLRQALSELAPASGRSGFGPVPLWGSLLPAQPTEDPRAHHEEQGDDRRGGQGETIELDHTMRLQRISREQREDKPIFHVFEKLETAEDFGGQTSSPDPEGNLQKQEDAVRDLELGSVIRTTETPENMIRADVIAEPTGLVIGDRDRDDSPEVFEYPEWNHKRREYRAGWCTVTEETPEIGDAAANRRKARELVRAHHRQVDSVRTHLERALFQRQLRTRQLEGPEIDVEAVVERHADLAAGRTPPERLYLSAKRRLKDVAIVILLDTSFSTDSWIEGRRVLDIELESVLVLAEAFRGFVEDEVAVASFRSHTRNDCRFLRLKRFQDPWDRLLETAPGLAPEGYTRIGPAVRHATSWLDASRAERKLLLLVSDGKPTDYDQYEGTYGVEDVSQAIREARNKRIHAYGLAVEKEAKMYLSRMMGVGRFHVLPQTSMLADAMGDVLTKFVAS